MPILDRAPNKMAMDKTNDRLMKEFGGSACQTLEVNARDGGAFADNRVWLANERFFAFGGASGENLGGNESIYAFGVDTYDLSTGDKVDFRKLFEAVKNAKASSLEDAGGILALVARHVDPTDPCWTEALENVLPEASCGDVPCSPPIDWHPEVFPTNKGLAVLPGWFPYAESNCEAHYVVLPWDEARTALLTQQPMP